MLIILIFTAITNWLLLYRETACPNEASIWHSAWSSEEDWEALTTSEQQQLNFYQFKRRFFWFTLEHGTFFSSKIPSITPMEFKYCYSSAIEREREPKIGDQRT